MNKDLSAAFISPWKRVCAFTSETSNEPGTYFFFTSRAGVLAETAFEAEAETRVERARACGARRASGLSSGSGSAAAREAKPTPDDSRARARARIASPWSVRRIGGGRQRGAGAGAALSEPSPSLGGGGEQRVWFRNQNSTRFA